MAKLTYSDAGVNLKAWHDTRDRISALVKRTHNSRVLGGFGQFGGLYDATALKSMSQPVLVSSVDGVGTKLKIAIAINKHDTVGADIVNHCINDILVMGARPMFFLDYIATGKLTPVVVEDVLKGMTDACRGADCVLIGGETAEMPGFYGDGEYDIAGTIVGIVERDSIIDGRTIRPGDTLIGLRSSGLHTNGYSLARKIVTDVAKMRFTDCRKSSDKSIGEELLAPHRAYSPLLSLMGEGLIKGCAHITGGGFQENVDRILPGNCDAVIETKTWRPDPLFEFLQKSGGVENDEMYRTFNMGIGMVFAVDTSIARTLVDRPELAAFEPRRVGRIIEGAGVVRMEY